MAGTIKVTAPRHETEDASTLPPNKDRLSKDRHSLDRQSQKSSDSPCFWFKWLLLAFEKIDTPITLPHHTLILLSGNVLPSSSQTRVIICQSCELIETIYLIIQSISDLKTEGAAKSLKANGMSTSRRFEWTLYRVESLIVRRALVFARERSHQINQVYAHIAGKLYNSLESLADPGQMNQTFIAVVIARQLMRICTTYKNMTK